MKVEFRKSFEKDLGKIRDEELLVRIKAIIEEVENADSLLDIGKVLLHEEGLRRVEGW